MLKEQGNKQMTLLNPPDDVDLIQIIGAFLKFLGSVFCGSLVPSEGNWPSDSTPQPYKATDKWLGWIHKTMHICGLSQFQQQVKLLASQ